MNKCDIRVVAAAGRDRTTLSETFRRLGYAVVPPTDDITIHTSDEIVVVDARGTEPADWEQFEHDLGDSTAPTVVISDEHSVGFVAVAQRLGRSVVFASGESDVGYGVAMKLCELMLEERHQAVAA